MANDMGPSTMYLKIGSVEGEVEEAHHKGWISIESFKFEYEQPTTPVRDSTGSVIERATHEPVSVTKRTDKSSASLLKACWGGTRYDTVIIEAYRTIGKSQDQLSYVKYELSDVVIGKVSQDSQSNELPEEELELVYTKINFKYSYTNKETGQYSGQTSATHDLIKNEIS